MKKELGEEFSELLKDRGWWAPSASISFPAIIGILLAIIGKPQVLRFGLYVYLLALILINARYVLLAKKTVEVKNFLNGTTEDKIVDRYPHLHPYARGSSIFSLGVTFILLIVPPFNTPVVELVYGTRTPTPMNTSTPTSTSTKTATASVTFTPSLSPTSTPEAQGIYYMFVLDASLKMTETFEVQTKWDAALRAVDALLVGFEDGANYGLVTIGGAPEIGVVNPCKVDSLVTLPFTTKKVVGEQVGQLQPGGGGSLYQAFVVAKNQFDNLPKNTVRTLVYITGSEDACADEDEWVNLERYFRAKGDDGLNIYSEIIIIDDGLKSQTIAEHISSISTKVNAQAPQTIFQLVQTNNTVINNVSNYVDITISSFPTGTPVPTVTKTSTSEPPITITIPDMVTVVNAPPNSTNTFTPIPPTVTPIPPTHTPTFTFTPSLTFTPAPVVSLLYVDYVGSGEGCSANIHFLVSGNSASGYFRITNNFYRTQSPPYDPGYPFVELPIGQNGYQVGLGGSGDPINYYHEVWFEYNGGESNHLTNLICPGLTPVP